MTARKSFARSRVLCGLVAAMSIGSPASSGAQLADLPGVPRNRDNQRKDYPHPRVMKLVFDLDSTSPSPGDVNPGLTGIADLMRSYGNYGRHTPKLKVVVVLHGKTTDLALDAQSSAKRFAGVTNGSIALMRSLSADGVVFIVSRQALVSRHIDESEIQSIIRFGPSAEMIFLDLEASGYIFDGTKGLASD